MSKNSTNVTFSDADYKALKKLADEEDRTVAGQARYMLRKALWPEPQWQAGDCISVAGVRYTVLDDGTLSRNLNTAPHLNPTSATSGPVPG